MEERYLKLKVIWKDDDMFELQVTATNGRYSGMAEVYDTKESLLPFADELIGYPKGKGIISHSCGEKNNYAFFEMKFYPIGYTGKVGVQISLEENVATDYRKEEKDKLTMELIVEPNSIDKFQNELLHLARHEEGEAILLGIGKYTSNVK